MNKKTVDTLLTEMLNENNITSCNDLQKIEETFNKLKEDDDKFETNYKKYINLFNKVKKNFERITNIKQFELEQLKDYDYVVGIDEVGRGPLAGPVVAVAISMKKESFILKVDDSKKLTEPTREELFDKIKNDSIICATGRKEAVVIDKVNILNATFLAMKEAYDSLNIPNDKKVLILVDGNKTIPYITYENVTQKAIVKGDAKVYSIACASIIAKVTRDREMNKLDEKYPEYDFKSNKGYGTSKHLEAISKVGIINEIHRKTFVKKIIEKQN